MPTIRWAPPSRARTLRLPPHGIGEASGPHSCPRLCASGCSGRPIAHSSLSRRGVALPAATSKPAAVGRGEERSGGGRPRVFLGSSGLASHARERVASARYPARAVAARRLRVWASKWCRGSRALRYLGSSMHLSRAGGLRTSGPLRRGDPPALRATSEHASERATGWARRGRRPLAAPLEADPARGCTRRARVRRAVARARSATTRRSIRMRTARSSCAASSRANTPRRADVRARHRNGRGRAAGALIRTWGTRSPRTGRSAS